MLAATRGQAGRLHFQGRGKRAAADGLHGVQIGWQAGAGTIDSGIADKLRIQMNRLWAAMSQPERTTSEDAREAASSHRLHQPHFVQPPS